LYSSSLLMPSCTKVAPRGTSIIARMTRGDPPFLFLLLPPNHIENMAI